jgi:hypothetical protein
MKEPARDRMELYNVTESGTTRSSKTDGKTVASSSPSPAVELPEKIFHEFFTRFFWKISQKFFLGDHDRWPLYALPVALDPRPPVSGNP